MKFFCMRAGWSSLGPGGVLSTWPGVDPPKADKAPGLTPRESPAPTGSAAEPVPCGNRYHPVGALREFTRLPGAFFAFGGSTPGQMLTTLSGPANKLGRLPFSRVSKGTSKTGHVRSHGVRASSVISGVFGRVRRRYWRAGAADSIRSMALDRRLWLRQAGTAATVQAELDRLAEQVGES